MGKQIFRLQLDDYSTPGFCSSFNDYFGTLEMVEGFIDAIRNDKEDCEKYKDLISTFDRYKEGEVEIMHNVAYKDRPFLVRAKCIAERESKLSNYTWEHLNVWQWPYNMRCKTARNKHVWLVCHKQFFRCIQTEFTDLAYEHLDGRWEHPGMLWGYPHMIEIEKRKTYNRLFIMEKRFNNRGELLADIELFDRKPDPNYREFLNDIFGDG